MREYIRDEYLNWVKEVDQESDLGKELQKLAQKEEQLEDAFYRNLEFGTGGLRGVLGAGTNRMNIYTVAKATQGLAEYIKQMKTKEVRAVAVSYDSRILSDVFAKTVSEVFAANGIQSFLYRELMPTPCLSFAVRELHCSAGVMITASHNPGEYNGYKVYGADGCQITTEAAKRIYEEIEKVDIFHDICRMDFDKAVQERKIQYIPEEVYDRFVDCVLAQSMLTKKDEIDKNVSIVYTPLNGSGLKPVMRTLEQAGYTNITVVEEQRLPDGRFPTCNYPNPEERAAMELGLQYAREYQADLLIATDPDCDRAGIAVKNSQGEYQLLSGNETGVLLLDYICARRTEQHRMPEHPILVKTIVTTDMADKIAAHYGVETRNVLTGFKFIGEQIGFLEENQEEQRYIFGFEESYGYLSGSYVRDKDAVNAALLICEMFAYYKTRNINLIEKLEELYSTYGYYANSLYSYKFPGEKGMQTMQEIMAKLRKDSLVLDGIQVQNLLDYKQGIGSLPKADVLKFVLDQGTITVRPSGTEPKLKLYLSICAKDKKDAKEIEHSVVQTFEKLCKGI